MGITIQAVIRKDRFTVEPIDVTPRRAYASSTPAGDGSADEPATLGVEFYSNSAASVTHIHFWQPASGAISTASRTVGIYDAITGSIVGATQTLPVSGTGWQTAALASPVAITAWNRYRAAVYHPAGGYAATAGWFTTGTGATQLVNGCLRIPPAATAIDNKQGSFHYTTGIAFPDGTFSGGHYWTDVTIVATGLPPSGPFNVAANPSLGGYPDATSTGPAAGTTFIRVPADATSGTGWTWDGGSVIPTAGATLNGLDIAGSVSISAPNVTVQNCIVTAFNGPDGDVIAVRYNLPDVDARGSNAHIVNCRLGSNASYPRARSCVRDVYGGATGLVITGNDMSGTGNGVSTEIESIVTDNWIHDLGHIALDHHSGLSTHGGATSILWEHNTVLLYGMTFPGGGGVSGALTVDSDFGSGQNVTVRNNLISGGSYTVYGGGTPSSNVKFLNNRFVRDAWDNGPRATFYADQPGNEWSGNYADQDGSPIP